MHPSLLRRSLAAGALAALAALTTFGLNARGREDGITEVALASLPDEARSTYRLIDAGGPFPYRRDGIEFQNREKRLPARDRGCYREYTVPTPGSSDRGARRIVADCEGPRYYSSDHYRSFRRIRP